MVRIFAARCCLLAGLLIACAGGEPLHEGQGQPDAATGAGGNPTTTGHGGRSGSGGAGASGGDGGESGSAGTDGRGGGGSGGADFDANAGRGGGGSGGADFDASAGRGGTGGTGFDAGAGRGGSSGTAARDASVDEASTSDAIYVDRGGETGGIEGGDTEAGTCGPMFCFDVFECWFLFPQCGYTACELFACKK